MKKTFFAMLVFLLSLTTGISVHAEETGNIGYSQLLHYRGQSSGRSVAEYKYWRTVHEIMKNSSSTRYPHRHVELAIDM